jgi:tetratricopeptide (TPR) repeat protein
MKQVLISISLFILALNGFGQAIYMELGNRQLNDQEFVAAEKTFREAIKFDSSNLIFQNQLALCLVKQKKHSEAQKILDKVLSIDSSNAAALWYSGTNNFLDNKADLRTAIIYFEKVLPQFNEAQGQYFSANWFIGRAYQILLQSNGLTYGEVSRMIDCYSTYLRLQPNANDAASIAAYVERIKNSRPPDSVKKWVNKQR